MPPRRDDQPQEDAGLNPGALTNRRGELGVLHPPHPGTGALGALLTEGYIKIGIVGAPGVGKTTLVKGTSVPAGYLVVATDDLDLDDDALVKAVAMWLMPKAFVVEGVGLPQLVEAGLRLDVLLWVRGRSTGRDPRSAGLGAQVNSWAMRYTGYKREVWR